MHIGRGSALGPGGEGEGRPARRRRGRRWKRRRQGGEEEGRRGGEERRREGGGGKEERRGQVERRGGEEEEERRKRRRGGLGGEERRGGKRARLPSPESVIPSVAQGSPAPASRCPESLGLLLWGSRNTCVLVRNSFSFGWILL